MAIFGPKPWVNPIEKMSIFRLFGLLLFIAQKGVISFQNFRKHFFLAYIAKEKKLEKWPFFDQNHGLNPLEKSQFFDLLNFLFLQPRKAFFRCRMSLKTFSWPIFSKKKKLEKWPFSDQNQGLTPLEKCQFFDFLNFFFLQLRRTFFMFQNIVNDIFLAYIAYKQKGRKNGHF